eukprot:3705008-Prorocentrum_lima.AAC.1
MEAKLAEDRATMQQHVHRLQLQEQPAEAAIALERAQKQRIGSEVNEQNVVFQSEAQQFEQSTQALMRQRTREELQETERIASTK